jgi:predicted DCC family thiol-disulfide oxidoreductase YuxK
LDTVIFDGECGICNETRQWVEARDRGRRLTFVPYQVADLSTLSPGLTADTASRMAFYVTPDGRRVGGARAIFLCLKALPGAWGVIGAVGAFVPVSLLAEPFYRVVAHNRARISGWLGLSYCLVAGRPTKIVGS